MIGFIFAGMSMFIPYDLLNNRFLVTAGRSIYWENEKALILSDLHLGKTGHFRKAGIAVPQSVMMEDMQRLLSQLQFYKPKQLIIVGDLFHSTANKEHDLFLKWIHDMKHVNIYLIKGNHDILQEKWYTSAGINLCKDSLTIGDFSFIHDINDCAADENKYCFSGHIHPGIRLTGGGRQSLQLACFYFGKEYAVLPAFGKFTGTYTIKPQKDDAVFALVENGVMKVQ